MRAKINAAARTALADSTLQSNLKRVIQTSLGSRQAAVAEISNWEEMRQYASDVKDHTLACLPDYLEQLERNIAAQGGKVLWAETGQEAVEMVVDLARERRAREVVKGKSMLTEEIHLNESLERAGIFPVETDLGEHIVQLAGEKPSHLTAPALHKSKEDVIRLYVEELGMRGDGDVDEVMTVTRRLLREHFLKARIGITGANFAVAETGTVVIVENEGNVRLSCSVPNVHVALMGIEKVVPRMRDLAVFLTLLVRSATGQKMTSYVNCINGPRGETEQDGPEEFYLILVDNGRSKILQDPLLRRTLACIRCGACQNACPVYQRIGGHAYGSVYQGPIGAILTPQLQSRAEAPEHAYASSLCGACQEVCPVKIEIPEILLKLREEVQRHKGTGALNFSLEQPVMWLWARVMESPAWYELLAPFLRFLMRTRPEWLPFPPLRQWALHREPPEWPPRSFRELFCVSEEGS